MMKEKEQQITDALRQIARQEVPDSVDLWPAIKAQRQAEKRRTPGRLVPVTRLGWVSLTLALILAFGAGAYALSPAIGRLFQQEPGLKSVDEARLVQEFALSQTIDGVTVTLTRAYADANRIIIGFTIQDTEPSRRPSRRYEAHPLVLTDATGAVFPQTFGLGVTGQSDLFDVSLPPGEGAYVLAFDAAAVTGTPEELHLQLVMGLEELAINPSALNQPPASTEEALLSLNVAPEPPSLEQPAPGEPIVEVLEPLPKGDILGPFTFEFSVPFLSGQTVEVQQTVEANGIAIRLERVVVTPSETRATLCFQPPEGKKAWLLLTEDGGQDILSPIADIADQGTGGEECHRLTYPGELASQGGMTTLSVTELMGYDGSPADDQRRLAGPWEFRFQMP